jgi:hypothetical protein
MFGSRTTRKDSVLVHCLLWGAIAPLSSAATLAEEEVLGTARLHIVGVRLELDPASPTRSLSR